MSSSFGGRVRVQLFGQSHSRGLGAVIDGLPAGEKIDLDRVGAFLRRRMGGLNSYSTARAESDAPEVLCGLVGGRTCGAPICAVFENSGARPSDYAELRHVPRPSHADYAAHAKHSGLCDHSGGGHFSGRLTLPLCFAGAVCIQVLERRGVSVGARALSIAGVRDDPVDPGEPFGVEPPAHGFPTAGSGAAEEMIRAIEAAKAAGDSVGGVVECGAWGLPAGLGDPIFGAVESRIAAAVFGIPAVKGVEFGAGFGAAGMRGSECNDPFFMDGGRVRARTNNSGGILGGITSGMPVIFRAAFKPTPSIALPQESVNLATGQGAEVEIRGRHDPCIVPRAVPCVIAAAAAVICDIVLGG